VLLSAVLARCADSAGTELSVICAWIGQPPTPRLSEKQILPAESETTMGLRFTPSSASETPPPPSAGHTSRTRLPFTTPLRQFVARKRAKHDLRSRSKTFRFFSSAIPTICSRKNVGRPHEELENDRGKKGKGRQKFHSREFRDESSKRHSPAGEGQTTSTVA